MNRRKVVKLDGNQKFEKNGGSERERKRKQIYQKYDYISACDWQH